MAHDDSDTPGSLLVPRARTAAPPTSGPGLLQRGWRAAAEAGPPALVVTACPAAEAPGSVGSHEVVWVNRGLTELLGLDATELTGSAVAEVADVAVVQGAAQGWAAVAQDLLRGNGGQREAAVRRLDGSESRVRLHVAAVDARRGADADGWLITLHPLTDAALDAEAALREAEHRFNALAESAPIGIFLSEAGMRLGYVNDRFVALTGVESFRLLGTGWLDEILSDDLPAVFAAAASVLAGTSEELAVRIAGGGTTPRWLNLRLEPTTTPARAAGFIGTAEDITDRRAWEEKITYQAQHDPLTGLVNRRQLIETLEAKLASKRGVDRQVAVLFLDLDGFKHVNDTYGHEAGDRVLIEVARRMRRTARDADLLARVAGDEFVVILGHIGAPEDAEAAARRHLAALSAPMRVAGVEVTVSASIGIAVPTPDDSPESIMRTADQMMYAAKAAGSGRYRIAVPGRSS